MRKNIRVITAVVMSAALAFGMTATVAEDAVAATLKLNKKNLNMKVGDKFTLKVTGNKTKKVKWSSNKKKVATVTKKGLVKAMAKGNAKITAKVASKKLICKVKVSAKTETKVTEAPVVTNAPVTNPTVAPSTATTPAQTGSPTTAPTTVPTATATATPTQAPTEEPGPTATPEYMQEGAFVYDKLDISWIDPEKPMIAFTFDDGPVGNKDTDYSMRIQKVLKDYGCHATFNYVTSKINNDANKDEILKSMENGNEIANHTSQWDSLSSFSSGEAIAAEIEKARATLEELTGITNFTLRPPNLGVSNLVYDNCNVPLIGCNIISNDWETATTKEHIVEVTKGAKDGDIVLFHETMEHTAEAVEELVPYFIDKGYQIVSVVELFAAKDIPLFAGNYYNKAEYMPPRN